MAGILAFARARDITSASFQAIGAFKTAVLGFFDFDRRAYDRIPVDGQAEVVSLTGNIAREGEEPRLHAHAVLGGPTGQAVAGHLLEAVVRPTLEVILVESPAHLARAPDPATGLSLISRGVEA